MIYLHTILVYRITEWVIMRSIRLNTVQELQTEMLIFK